MIIISTFMLDTHFKLVLKVLTFPVNIVLMCTLSFNQNGLFCPIASLLTSPLNVPFHK